MDSTKKSQDFIRRIPEGLVFKIYVQPKSSKNLIVGRHGDELKIRLTAPPADNAANRLCIKFLAKQLDVSKSALEIIAGHAGRHKQILVRFNQADSAENEYRHLANSLTAFSSDK